MIAIPRSSALVLLLGPILSPATTKFVFLEIELETFPPFCSISFFNSFLETLVKTPETTKVFPFNLFVRLQFKFKYGLYNFKNNFLYVSSGSGPWGPKMRLGTRNEVILFNLNKK